MRILKPGQLDAFLKGRNLALNRAEAVARPIIADVRRRGDRAVAEYARKFDKYDGPLRVDHRNSWKTIDPKVRAAMKVAAANIETFARLQMPKEWMRTVVSGVRAGQIVRPIESAGCYAPGGRFPLPSTVLMTAIPARVAGVKHVAVACPRGPAVVMAAASLAKADAFYPIGGVHAIAAMAYGTRTIRQAARIVGPGSIYVTAAKKLIAADSGIDFIAGPTEIVLVASAGNPDWIAADMKAQAEHDPAAVSILVTPSSTLAASVAERVTEKNCATVVVGSVGEAMETANRIAPEHLWLDDPAMLAGVTNAGSVFLGAHSAVAAGDYATGPNHTLPTSGGARLRGGLSIADFLKIVTVQELTPRGLARIASTVATLARAEGLEQHARSVELRQQ